MVELNISGAENNTSKTNSSNNNNKKEQQCNKLVKLSATTAIANSSSANSITVGAHAGVGEVIAWQPQRFSIGNAALEYRNAPHVWHT